MPRSLLDAAFGPYGTPTEETDPAAAQQRRAELESAGMARRLEQGPFVSGLESGFKGGLASGQAFFGKLAGDQTAVEDARRRAQVEATYGPQQTFMGIRSLPQAYNWLAGSAGQALGSTAPVIGSALLAAPLGPVGMAAAPFLTGSVLEGGEVPLEDPNAPIEKMLTKGAVGGALEAVVPFGVARAARGLGKIGTNLERSFAGGMAAEAGTEAGQQATQDIVMGRQPTSEDLIEAAAQGAVGGGIFGLGASGLRRSVGMIPEVGDAASWVKKKSGEQYEAFKKTETGRKSVAALKAGKDFIVDEALPAGKTGTIGTLKATMNLLKGSKKYYDKNLADEVARVTHEALSGVGQALSELYRGSEKFAETGSFKDLGSEFTAESLYRAGAAVPIPIRRFFNDSAAGVKYLVGELEDADPKKAAKIRKRLDEIKGKLSDKYDEYGDSFTEAGARIFRRMIDGLENAGEAAWKRIGANADTVGTFIDKVNEGKSLREAAAESLPTPDSHPLQATIQELTQEETPPGPAASPEALRINVEELKQKRRTKAKKAKEEALKLVEDETITPEDKAMIQSIVEAKGEDAFVSGADRQQLASVMQKKVASDVESQGRNIAQHSLGLFAKGAGAVDSAAWFAEQTKKNMDWLQEMKQQAEQEMKDKGGKANLQASLEQDPTYSALQQAVLTHLKPELRSDPDTMQKLKVIAGFVARQAHQAKATEKGKLGKGEATPTESMVRYGIPAIAPDLFTDPDAAIQDISRALGVTNILQDQARRAATDAKDPQSMLRRLATDEAKSSFTNQQWREIGKMVDEYILTGARDKRLIKLLSRIYGETSENSQDQVVLPLVLNHYQEAFDAQLAARAKDMRAVGENDLTGTSGLPQVFGEAPREAVTGEKGGADAGGYQRVISPNKRGVVFTGSQRRIPALKGSKRTKEVLKAGAKKGLDYTTQGYGDFLQDVQGSRLNPEFELNQIWRTLKARYKDATKWIKRREAELANAKKENKSKEEIDDIGQALIISRAMAKEAYDGLTALEPSMEGDRNLGPIERLNKFEVIRTPKTELKAEYPTEYSLNDADLARMRWNAKAYENADKERRVELEKGKIVAEREVFDPDAGDGAGGWVWEPIQLYAPAIAEWGRQNNIETGVDSSLIEEANRKALGFLNGIAALLATGDIRIPPEQAAKLMDMPLWHNKKKTLGDSLKRLFKVHSYTDFNLLEWAQKKLRDNPTDEELAELVQYLVDKTHTEEFYYGEPKVGKDLIEDKEGTTMRDELPDPASVAWANRSSSPASSIYQFVDKWARAAASKDKLDKLQTQYQDRPAQLVQILKTARTLYQTNRSPEYRKELESLASYVTKWLDPTERQIRLDSFNATMEEYKKKLEKYPEGGDGSATYRQLISKKKALGKRMQRWIAYQKSLRTGSNARPNSGSASEPLTSPTSKYSLASNHAGKSMTAKQRKAVEKMLTKVLGKKYQLVEGENPILTGLFNLRNDTDVITIFKLATNPMGVGYHEALHAMMSRFGRSDNEEVRKIGEKLLKFADDVGLIRSTFDLLMDAEVQTQMATGLSKDAATEKALASPAIKQFLDSREERLAYMYQFWQMGALDINKPVYSGLRKIFQQIKEWIAQKLNVALEWDQAQVYLEAISEGHFADFSNAYEVLRTMDYETIGDKMNRWIPALNTLHNKVLAVAPDQLRSYNIPELSHIADLFQKRHDDMAGGLGYIHRKQRETSKRMNQVKDILTKYSPKVQTEALVALQTFQEAKSAEAKALQQEIAGYFNEMFNYATGAGVEVYNRKTKKWEPLRKSDRYFFRMWDYDAISKDKKKFMALLEQEKKKLGRGSSGKALMREVFEHENGVTPGEAEAGKSANQAREGAVGYSPLMIAANERVLSQIDKSNAHLFQKYMKQDLMEIMTAYTRQTVARAEYVRVFEKRGEKISRVLNDILKRKQVSEPEWRDINHAIMGLTGTLRMNMNTNTKHWMSAAIMAQNMALLSFSLVTNLMDVLSIWGRANDSTEAWNAMKIGIGGLFKDLSRSKTIDEREEMARTIGIIEDDLLLDYYGHTYIPHFVSKNVQKWNRQFFRWNGMEGWNRRMRIAAMGASERFLIKHAKAGLKEESSRRFLTELGVSPNDIVVNPDTGRLVWNKEGLMARGKTEEEAEGIASRVQEAMYKFVDTAVLRPSAATRPTWGNDPAFAWLLHLKQFTYAFQDVMIRRAARESDWDNYSPMMSLLAGVPFQMATGAAKGWIGISATDNWGMWDYLANGVDRSGILGTGQFLVDAKQDVKWGKVPGYSFMGPVFDHAVTAFETFTGKESVENLLYRTLPAGNLVKKIVT